MPQLANNVTVTALDAGVTGNGRYHLYTSPDLSDLNNKAIDINLQVTDVQPNRDGAATGNLGKAVITVMLERKDDGGNWHVVHTLFEPILAVQIGASENGGIIPAHQLSYGPNVLNLDGAKAIWSTDGVNSILADHQKRGVLPDVFRICVVVNEREFGNGGAFQSATFSLDYELRAE